MSLWHTTIEMERAGVNFVTVCSTMSNKAKGQNPKEALLERIEHGDKIRVIDLFCGAGGMSAGVAEAIEEIATQFEKPIEDIAELHAVNHWDTAISSHAENFPWATQYHSPIQQLNPRDVVDGDKRVDLLVATPDCTYFSPARGGGPKDRDKRMTPREVLDWVERLSVQRLLFENVPAFRGWGPLDEENCVIQDKKGEYFDHWIDSLAIEGFSVEHRVLNCADFGDPTSRKRLFVCGTKNGAVSWPEPTHSEDGSGETQPWRTAKEVIDWSDPGENLWIRDLNDGRRKPLVNNTMKRIAEGIRRHCSDALEPFADTISKIGRGDEDDPVAHPLPELRERVVPAEYASQVAAIVDEPFLVKYHGTSPPQSVNQPMDTITAGGRNYALCTPYLLGQHSNSVARAIDQRPVSTVTTDGNISLLTPSTFLLRQHDGEGAHPLNATESPLPTVTKSGAISKVETRSFILPRNGRNGGLFSNESFRPAEKPLQTVIASDTRQGYFLSPQLMQYSHGGSLLDVDEPLPTITTAKGGVFSLSQPTLVPFYNERADQNPRTHAIESPLPTIPASKVPAGVSNPFLVEYYNPSNARPLEINQPVPTIPTKDRFALVVPELFPYGLEIGFRMLKPKELAAAQGFPTGYKFCGNKTETVKQIGNAVPVRTAKSLVEEILIGQQPAVTDFISGETSEEGTTTA